MKSGFAFRLERLVSNLHRSRAGNSTRRAFQTLFERPHDDVVDAIQIVF